MSRYTDLEQMLVIVARLCADGYSIGSLQQSIVTAYEHFRMHRDSRGLSAASE